MRTLRTPARPTRNRSWFLAGLVLAAWGCLASQAGDPDNCLFCHRFRGLSRYNAQSNRVHVFFIDPYYVENQAGPHALLACTACHPWNDVAVIPHRPVSRVDCTQLCHLAPPGQTERLFSHSAVLAMLNESVHSWKLLGELTSSHGPLLEPGQSECLYCHDEPVFRNLGSVLPTLSVLGARVFDRCDVCHTGQIPVDVPYYLRHVAARLQPARSSLNLAQVCAVCHADPSVYRRYHLKDTVASYMQSFHGMAALLGDQRAANCLSCHVGARANAHLMFAQSDPRSSVNRANIASTCRTTACHPGAEPQFADAAVHLDLPTERTTPEFAVAVAFIVLTIGTFVPSLLICVLELLQIVVGRHHESRQETLVLVRAVLHHPQGRRRLTRFTVSQRCQHWVLVVLFITLAATGFSMKVADHAWAQRVVSALGGLRATRTVHHWAGVALVVGFLAHLVYTLPTLRALARQPAGAGRRLGLWRGLWRLPMVISPAEMRKAVQLLAYLLGLRREPPTFGRFDVRQKFEYIGVFWGTTLLGLTGVLLWGVQVFSAYFSGRVFSIALIAHTYEAFLAVIHVGILHIVNVVFAPNVFPLSLATITGVTPALELADAHADFVEDAARDLDVRAPEVPGYD